MKYLAAYLLLAQNGKETTVDSISQLLATVGIEADAAKIESLLKSVEGKTVEELIAEGNSKLATVPTGGAAAAGSASAAAGSSEAAAEEKEESAAEESDDDMGFGLFD
jgi:large subunit ribosomal protein LP2